ncbi:galactosyltransferase-related protein [Ostreibacterium oceani]|uniref:Uncharacterized protein n=1 Tax=Ostreibacterium oceani TaxID=2654998 RepID=A0A6N7F2B0_9GAMM|nr:galactosyltransferase-related protein [Ostreibacterium oceani]MPV86006.1 hypothetical protein [Ostreibacterium oceani]
MTINKFLPQHKITKDVTFEYNQAGSIKPIEIIGISLTSPIKRTLMELRKKNTTFEIKKYHRKMTLIVPYRHRREHLKLFLPYIKNYLDKQKIDYEIIIVEQTNSKPFNKAKLMNIGAKNARKDSEYFVFHDVDLLPENIDYRYCSHTLKLFFEIKHEKDSNYKEYKQTVLGGAVLVPKDIFFDINGYSNNYWQWGREDDDFFIRHLFKGHIALCDNNGKFKALEHNPSILKNNDGKVSNDPKTLKENKRLLKNNKKRYTRIKTEFYAQDNDGVSTLTDYKIENITINNDVKTILVDFSGA